MATNSSRPALGVIFHPKFPPETLAAYAGRAEDAGFDELWLWDDCFLPGAFTSAAIALSATSRLKVGIGLLPATAYNPLFAAMEITTLARAFPGRILPGFGHGLDVWMAQIGAAPQSTMKTLKATVQAVRRLLGGEMVTSMGDQVNLDRVQMQMTPDIIPPLYVGAMRPKTLRLAGMVGDGAILPAMSSPAYVRWALEHMRAGAAESGQKGQRMIVYLNVKVNPDGAAARAAARRLLASQLRWVDAGTDVLGIATETARFLQDRDPAAAAEQMPDEWLDAFTASGTPRQAMDAIQRLGEAGADSIVFQPLDGDPACLDEYINLLMPLLKTT